MPIVHIPIVSLYIFRIIVLTQLAALRVRPLPVVFEAVILFTIRVHNYWPSRLGLFLWWRLRDFPVILGGLLLWYISPLASPEPSRPLHADSVAIPRTSQYSVGTGAGSQGDEPHPTFGRYCMRQTDFQLHDSCRLRRAG